MTSSSDKGEIVVVLSLPIPFKEGPHKKPVFFSSTIHLLSCSFSNLRTSKAIDSFFN